jgi:hypothetical protein
MRPRERLLLNGIPKEAIRKELERGSDRLFRWNLFFSATVGVGLTIEFVPDAASFLGVFSHTVFMVLHTHSGPLHEFGGFVVVVGIVAEVFIARRDRHIETDLRDESNSEIGILHGRAATAEREAAEARRETAEANGRTEAVRLCLAETDKMVITLRMAQEPRARSFNFRKFAGFLEGKPKTTVKIFCRIEDEEAAEFGELIRNTLLASHWSVEGPTLLLPGASVPALQAMGAKPEGITVMQRSIIALALDDPYKILCDAFTFVNVMSLVGRANPRIAEGEAWIVIGAKP